MMTVLVGPRISVLAPEPRGFFCDCGYMFVYSKYFLYAENIVIAKKIQDSRVFF